MAKQHLSTHLRQYYEEKEPSVAKLAYLVAMADMASDLRPKNEDTQKNTVSASGDGDRRIWITLGLSFALAAMLALFFLQPMADVTQRVAKEIVLNHNKRLSVEFPSENYADLGELMSKLDFSLVRSKKIYAQDFRVLGGRYCSIQGDLAAQIRLQDEAGRIYTLYQAALTDDLLKLEVGDLQQDGLKLKLWREAGLFFGLVGPVD